MSLKITSTVNYPQKILQCLPHELFAEKVFEDEPLLGGLLSDLKHTWYAKGPCLEVRESRTGRKTVSWTFRGTLQDYKVKIVAVEEWRRAYGKPPLLIVALNCPTTKGTLCVFDILRSTVLRSIQIGEEITSIHVVDHGGDSSDLPGLTPFKHFNGTVAIGTCGGNVFLMDLCKNLCEKGSSNMELIKRDEVNPTEMVVLDKENIGSIMKYAQRIRDQDEHTAIHLNAALSISELHYTLKGEDGDDRVHVNRSEVQISALLYTAPMAALIVGYNFGAFQLWDLRFLELLYTSPICEGNIPVTNFTVQEPADDPKAYCYLWVSFSHNFLFHSGLPFAVMYSFCFDSKKIVPGYGSLYEDFQHCSVKFQLDLGDPEAALCKTKIKGGKCLGFQSINKCTKNREISSPTLCVISWLVWNRNRNVYTAVLVFDLNQWYKAQMPRFPNWSSCSSYIINACLEGYLLDIKMDQKTLNQFMGIHRLEEHFCPTAMTFDFLAISDSSLIKIQNKGQQVDFLEKLVRDGQLALIKPDAYTEQILALGLTPLFCDFHISNSQDADYHRELVLSVALEQNLTGWICNVAQMSANNKFIAAGLSLEKILNWAFQRAITLKNQCDRFCVPLFDYSGIRLDDNTLMFIRCGASQIRRLCEFYRYVTSKLIEDKTVLIDEQRSLENVVVYYEVLLWMVNIGLLPEYQTLGETNSFGSAPYLVQDLTRYYNKKRAELQLACNDTFVEQDNLLFIDNFINIKGQADSLRLQWQEDGGSGLYPPPSLQSVLRTYFVNGPDILFKHSLVTYTLLDIAMTVDENNKIIKLLLKFPQIFDLTLSQIKIIQAFWHLDHDDYETALGTILNPCVLPEDLERWHHSVMMRSLLIQEQQSLALTYLRIRKPSIEDGNEFLTILSLLVSKNLLDEAFNFRKKHEGISENALLLHIFKECTRNELLPNILHRRMDSEEEKAFLEFIQSSDSTNFKDLQVFYYLLRSRFLEAFDTYGLNKKPMGDSKGLVGQEDATLTDKILRIYHSHMPAVHRKVMNIVREEGNALWKVVRRPKPLSVFVHNANDQVKYKSSLIYASLAKAKQTFNDTLNGKKTTEITTDDMPFLRTPTVFRFEAKSETPLLKSKVVEQSEDDNGPPAKIMKLSPRPSTCSPSKSRNVSMSISQSKLSTPIVRRKRRSLEHADSSSILPQSILKSARTVMDYSILDEASAANLSVQAACENSVKRLSLAGRKSIGFAARGHVKFDCPSENSSKTDTDEVFYSPESSSIASENKGDDSGVKSNVSRASLKFDTKIGEEDTTPEESQDEDQMEDRNKIKISVEESDLSSKQLPFQSPTSRRSYKRSFGESSSPVRSSLRLSRRNSQTEEQSQQMVIEEVSKPEALSPIIIPKLRGRRSLSRSVIENQALSRLEHSSKIIKESRSTVSSENELSSNDSFDLLYAKHQALVSQMSGSSLDSSLELSRQNLKNDSLTEVLVSKTTECRNVEIRTETLKNSVTGSLVFADETKSETYSKTSSVSVEENLQESSNLSVPPNKSSNVFNNDLSNEIRSERPNSPLTAKSEDFQVYEDLSSASEEVNEVLSRNEQNTILDISCSSSVHQQSNQKFPEANAKKCGDNGCEDVPSPAFDSTEMDMGFIGADVIEISSASSIDGSSENSNSRSIGERSGPGYFDPPEDVNSLDSRDSDRFNIQGSSEDSESSSSDRSRSSNSESSGSSVKVISEDIGNSRSPDLERLDNLDEDTQENTRAKTPEEMCDIDDDTTENQRASPNQDDQELDPLMEEDVVEIEVSGPVEIGKSSHETEEAHESERNTSNDQNQQISRRQTSDRYQADQTQLISPKQTTCDESELIKHVQAEESEVDQSEPSPKRMAIDKSEDINSDSSFVNQQLDTKSILCTLAQMDNSDEVSDVESTSFGAQIEGRHDESVVSLMMPIKKIYKGPAVRTPKLKIPTRTYSRKANSESTDDISPSDPTDSQSTVIKEKTDTNPASVEQKISEEPVFDDDVLNKTPILHIPTRTYSKKRSEQEELEPPQLDENEPLKEAEKSDEQSGEVSSLLSSRESSGSSIKSRNIQLNLREAVLQKNMAADVPKKIEEEDEENTKDKDKNSDSSPAQSSVESTKSPARRSMRVASITPSRKEMEVSRKPSAKGRGRKKIIADVDIGLADSSLSNEEYGTKVEESSEVTGALRVYARRTSKTTKAQLSSGSQASKRTRSASVDQPVISAASRKIRSKSIDLDGMPVSRVDGRIDAKGMLASISDVSKEDTRARTKSASHLGDYTTSRRLTRRQASMLENITEVNSHLPNLDEMDPLNLLDKQDFEGKPDTNEYVPGSPSSTLSTPTRIRSLTKNISSESSGTGIKSRLRRRSTDTISVASEQSDSMISPKRNRLETDTDESTLKNNRSRRAGSVSSAKSAGSDSSTRGTRSRRLTSAKIDLPEIQEDVEETPSRTNSRKRGRQ